MSKKSKPKNVDLFGELPNPVGRPRKYHNAAEKQRAYRQRLKERGMRVVTRVVPDDRIKKNHDESSKI